MQGRKKKKKKNHSMIDLQAMTEWSSEIRERGEESLERERKREERKGEDRKEKGGRRENIQGIKRRTNEERKKVWAKVTK